jgi:hypothetical protein
MCHCNKNYVLDMSYKLQRGDFLLSKIVAIKLAMFYYCLTTTFYSQNMTKTTTKSQVTQNLKILVTKVFSES